MIRQLRWRRIVLLLHRWIGACAALFLLVLATTGLCLNHAERLGLHSKVIRLPFVLDRYNMQSADALRTLQLGDDLIVTQLEQSLFLNASLQENVAGRLIGVQQGDFINVIVLDQGVVLLNSDGVLVEYLPAEMQPFEDITAVGTSPGGELVLICANGNWIPDADWLTFREYSGPVSTGSPQWIEADAELSASILESYNGRGPSIYRVLLDLHSGRLFGWAGRTVMDLTALAIVALVLSGFSSWIGRSRGPTRRVKQ